MNSLSHRVENLVPLKKKYYFWLNILVS